SSNQPGLSVIHFSLTSKQPGLVGSISRPGIVTVPLSPESSTSAPGVTCNSAALAQGNALTLTSPGRPEFLMVTVAVKVPSGLVVTVVPPCTTAGSDANARVAPPMPATSAT